MAGLAQYYPTHQNNNNTTAMKEDSLHTAYSILPYNHYSLHNIEEVMGNKQVFIRKTYQIIHNLAANIGLLCRASTATARLSTCRR